MPTILKRQNVCVMPSYLQDNNVSLGYCSPLYYVLQKLKLPRPLSSTSSLDGKYFQWDDSSSGNKIINWKKKPVISDSENLELHILKCYLYSTLKLWWKKEERTLKTFFGIKIWQYFASHYLCVILPKTALNKNATHGIPLLDPVLPLSLDWQLLSNNLLPCKGIQLSAEFYWGAKKHNRSYCD